MSSFQGKITHLSQKGLGVVHHPENGLSYFVAGTWPGDIGEFAITDRPLNNKKYGYARLIRLTQPSPQRKTPECRFLGFSGNDCSGCPWMIADYNSQLDQKRNRFLYAMHRTGFDPDRLKVGRYSLPPVCWAIATVFRSKQMVKNWVSLLKDRTISSRSRIAWFLMTPAGNSCTPCAGTCPIPNGHRHPDMTGISLIWMISLR